MSQDTKPAGSCLARLVWFMFGPAVMLILAFVNVERGGGWWSGLDIGFFIALAVTIAARCIDFGLGRPQTAMGTPANATHLRHYVAVIFLVAGSVWVIANLIGNH